MLRLIGQGTVKAGKLNKLTRIFKTNAGVDENLGNNN